MEQPQLHYIYIQGVIDHHSCNRRLKRDMSNAMQVSNFNFAYISLKSRDTKQGIEYKI